MTFTCGVLSEAFRLTGGDPFDNALEPREGSPGSGGSCASLESPLPDPTDDSETVDGRLAIIIGSPSEWGRSWFEERSRLVSRQSHVAASAGAMPNAEPGMVHFGGEGHMKTVLSSSQ